MGFRVLLYKELFCTFTAIDRQNRLAFMSTQNTITFLQTLINDAELMTYQNKQKAQILARAEMILRKSFGEANAYLPKLKKLGFIPLNTNPSPLDYVSKFNAGKKNLLALLSLAMDELKIDLNQIHSAEVQKDMKSIFIVHGHDTGSQQSIARTLEMLGLKPIILGEQANQGKTIIEKFEKHSNVNFAVVLMTNDDDGRVKGSEGFSGRARQNVILELGYFMGMLGRDRVLPLYCEGVELPSDLHGIVYTLLDAHGHWKYRLVKELKATGYDVDANALV